ncbi:MAG: bifunctional phosphoglucose/phosphomannose isomerase [Candidatus Aenigmarchaeota archaeon]|nr:bifunctional phosphoglucose/phosphomannose isomerase [Candidatus Aenigmarchaeota archaeon]
MIEDLESLNKQCKEGFELGERIKIKKPENILVCGMGGSGITGNFLEEMDLNIPVIVNKSDKIPRFVSKNTLVFCVSYSGNTRETISCYKKSKKRGANIVVITSGGKLGKMTKKNLIKIPSGFVPRAAFGYLFFSILGVLEKSGLMKISKEVKEIEKLNSGYFNKRGKELSKLFYKKMPLVYSNSHAVAYRWKTGLNENSKTLCLASTSTEIFHNEIEGYNNLNTKPFAIILDIDGKVNSKLKKILRKKQIGFKEIGFNGKLIGRMKGLWLSDFTSYYLGLKYKENPEETKMIDWFKKNSRYNL